MRVNTTFTDWQQWRRYERLKGSSLNTMFPMEFGNQLIGPPPFDVELARDAITGYDDFDTRPYVEREGKHG